MRVLEELGVELLWFDSLGAKSSSIYVESSAGGILIDPGAAAMQPSYPLPASRKAELRREALRRIEEYCWRSRVVVVTHYHYDHHVLPSDPELRDPVRTYLGGKLLVLKDPNKYINASQWGRARLFLEQLLSLAGLSLGDMLVEPGCSEFPDPVEELVHAHSRDYGDYTARRRELLGKGRRWFERLSRELWASQPWVRDGIVLGDGTRITWGDGRRIELGDAVVQVLGPWFHGIEYDRTGWVTPVLVERRGLRLVYTSDLMGPQVEDYAYRIADLKPHVVVADGPPTYLYPYMLNKVNLNRAVENMVYIVETATPRLIIYDHHLLRERRWRERVAPVFEASRRAGVPVVTAAEYLGRKPLIDTL